MGKARGAFTRLATHPCRGGIAGIVKQLALCRSYTVLRFALHPPPSSTALSSETIQFDASKASSPRQVEFANDRPQAGPPSDNGKLGAQGGCISPSLFKHEPDITPPHTPLNVASPGPFSNEDGFRIQHASDLLSPSEEFPSTWKTNLSQPRPSGGCPRQTEGLGRDTQRKAPEDGHGIVPQCPSRRSGSTTWDFATTTWTVVDAGQGNRGLRNAAEAAVRDGKVDHCTWIGTLGLPTEMMDGTQQKQDIEDTLATEHDMLAVFCRDNDFDGHYTHFCKQILWPVFHYQIPDGPKSRAYEDHSWRYYVNVNQRFADKIVDNWKHGDVIWVHDYHLLLVPGMVRKRLPDARIGFYLHVSFPSSEVFRCLAVRQQLLEDMLGANIIGFQVQEYARHFLQTCSRLLTVESTHEGVQLEDRFVDVAKVTIGIDPLKLEKHRGAADVMRWIGTLQDRYKGKRLIVGRDKLDHVRGVRQKLLSYELFLNANPEWRGHIVLIQVALSSSERTELEAIVADIVARINPAWANLAYQPVVYLKQDIDYAQYLALLSIADALMITSQREAMDLTPHEYIFCQDGKINPYQKYGPLILSEFTGASSLFNGDDLTVSPWSYRQCADAIKQAIEMSQDERKCRWERLYEAVTRHTAADWLGELNARLEQAYVEQHLRDQSSVPRLSIPDVLTKFKNSSRRLILLGFEGTLVNWGPINQIIPIGPQRALAVLNDLLLDDRNTVYVMSGRRPEELDGIVRMVPKLGVIAENGCFVRHCGSNEWTNMTNSVHIEEWKKSVKPLLTYFLERTPGTEIEERHCSLHFHYRNAEHMETASRQASACASQSTTLEFTECNAANAAQKVFDNLKARLRAGSHETLVDFLMVLGAGRHDEKVFKWANGFQRCDGVGSAVTVSVSNRYTEAKTTLARGVSGALSCLQRLASAPWD
ncbi:CAZyme family GT20 [Purpureocillium lilacinum]|uniref:CAZyme family GT20 n=1 Tax=Purpureocillium lilacinum TaxID=33203 RepID=A0ABR0BH41_PURLI|nr:CAZyme family GT20 [Purpureocillium lilacinum]